MKLKRNAKMIKDRDFFYLSLPAGFDGEFDWDALTNTCLPKYGNEDFMDIDAVYEKHGRFLHFETKSRGSNIPGGQKKTMIAYHNLGCITYIVLTFDTQEKNVKRIHQIGIWYPNDESMQYLDLKGKSYKERFVILCNLFNEWRYDADRKGKLTIKTTVNGSKTTPKFRFVDYILSFLGRKTSTVTKK